MVMDLHAYARIMTAREPELWRRAGHNLVASGVRRRGRPRPVPAADGRRRVLVENPDAATRAVMAQLLEGAGYAVETCAGPEAHEPARCPVLSGEVCPLAARADVIVSGLGLTRPTTRDVLRRLRALHRSVPILIDAPAPQVAAHPTAIEGCEVLPFPSTRASLLAAVRARAS